MASGLRVYKGSRFWVVYVAYKGPWGLGYRPRVFRVCRVWGLG